MGYSTKELGSCATIFDPTGAGNNIDLNTLIDPASTLFLEDAYDINNRGQIVGRGRNSSGDGRAFLLNPILIPAGLEIKPEKLNLKSNRKWIKCEVWLGEEFNISDIDTSTVLLASEVYPDQIWIDEDSQICTARFSYADLKPLLEEGWIELTVTGELIDGTPFEGYCFVTVTNPGKDK